MAEIKLTDVQFYKNGESGHSAVVGYESKSNRVARHTLNSPTSGASSVSLAFTADGEGAGTLPNTLRFYIGTDPASHANAGAGSEYTGTLTRQSGTYKYTGSVDIILLPNTIYYVWVFPPSTTFGWVYWSTRSEKAVATTSGGAVSSFTCNDGTLGTGHNIAVTKHNADFTHTITYTCGTASGTIADKASNTGITWTPPIELAEQNTAGRLVSVVITLQTFSGSNPIGDPVSKTVTMAIPDSVVPTCSICVADYMGYVTKYGAYVKGLSRFSVAVEASAPHGAEIVSYSITANGVVYTEPEFVTDAISSTEHTTITATVTDTRGRTSETVVNTVSVIGYFAPTVTALSAVRLDSDETKVKVTFSADVAPLNNLNRTTYIVYWRKTNAVEDEGSMVVYDYSQNYSVNNKEVIIDGIDTTSSYDVQVWVEDEHIIKTRTAIVPTSFALMHFRADGTGLAFGKLSERADAIEFGLPLHDKFGALIGNGLAAYNGGGASGIDPNTTLEDLCLTSHTNAPQGLGTFYYIHTVFYNTKSTTAARAQMAMPYNKSGSMYHRYYSGGEWSSWCRYMTADETYPVGSVVIRYDTTNPQTLYGGTWQRIEGRMLYGCASSGTVGATGSHTTGSGSSSLPYVNVAVWRRTA